MRLTLLCIIALPAFAQGPANPAAGPGPGAATSAASTSSSAATPPEYPPFDAKKKFERATEDAFSIGAFVFVAAGAGVDQLENIPREWHQGAEAYGERYGTVFGMNMSHEYFEFAIDSALHEDPRYYLSTDRSVKGRLKSVVKQAFITRTDDGGQQFALGRWGGALGAGFLASAWMPPSQRDFSSSLRRSYAVFGVDVGFNLAEEFIPFLRRLDHNK
jgi:hypothetical protein